VRFYQGLAYHDIDRDTLPYKAPFQPYASYFGIFFINLIILFNGFQVFLSKSWNDRTFITAYICLPIFLVFYLFWKIITRSKFVRIPDMDFTTGRRELKKSKPHNHYQVYHEFADHIRTVEEEELAKYVEPKGIVAKVWDWLGEFRSYPFKLQDMCSSCFLASLKPPHNAICIQCYFHNFAIYFIYYPLLLGLSQNLSGNPHAFREHGITQIIIPSNFAYMKCHPSSCQ
jgi:hypothetical protein